MSYAAKSPRQESNLPLPRSRRSNRHLRHRPGLLIVQRRSQATSLHHVLPHHDPKTCQGTTENGVGESNPAAEAASTEKKYPFSSPLTEVVAGEKDSYGLWSIMSREGTVACATQRICYGSIERKSYAIAAD